MCGRLGLPWRKTGRDVEGSGMSRTISNPREAAAELSRERDYEEDAGFTDEPVDDEEDDE